MLRHQLISYLDQLLQIQNFKDYCPNGLQIQGSNQINKIICGVSLNQQLIDIAIAQKADMIIVHHGIFWNKNPYPITGIKYQRIAKLIKHDINLLAYHLPLDCHGEFGNNVQLAKLLNIEVAGQTGEQNLIWHGKLQLPQAGNQFGQFYEQQTLHKPQLFGNTNKIINRIAWCTGSADSLFETAIDLGIDCFISGEVSEPIKAIAEEHDVIYLAGGHYVTERYGVLALSQHLQKLGMDCEFIELYNPI
jgi:dinuclear metal center YbgI/SA1388 family protein